MRALVMTAASDDAGQTSVVEQPLPRPGPREVSIDVAHAGVNFLDVMARRGDPGYAASWPYLPGLEVAGRIREVGADVDDLAPGQRVAAFTGGGGYAEIALAPGASTVPLPDTVATDVAAGAPLMLSTAMLLLTDVGHLRTGDTLLMHSAAGGLGSAVAQLARVLGAGKLIGTVGSPDKIESALAAGWDAVLARDDAGADALRAAAGGPIDVILDPLGTRMLDLDLDVAAPGARIALFGNPAGGVPAPLPPLGRLIGGNVALAGFSISRIVATAPHLASRALHDVLDLVGDGRLTVPVSVVDGLDEVPALHDQLAAGRGVGKYVVAL